MSSYIDTLQQNGVTERKNIHLLDVARSLMFSTNVPKHFWGEVVLTAAYLINRKTYPTTWSTTWLFSTMSPRFFGCSAFVHIHSQNRSKLDPRSIKCVFLEYSANQKDYKCYSPVTRRFYTSIDNFFEQKSYFTKTAIQGENVPTKYRF